jgi:hypothetical protein
MTTWQEEERMIPQIVGAVMDSQIDPEGMSASNILTGEQTLELAACITQALRGAIHRMGGVSADFMPDHLPQHMLDGLSEIARARGWKCTSIPSE